MSDPVALDATLTARLATLWPDVLRPLRALYGERPALERRLQDLLSAAYADRDPALRALDDRRLVTPDWFQRPDQVGYVCYTDRFAGTLAQLPERLGHLEELGVTYLHLMPLLRPREGADDGGYAVMDYRQVDPRLGDVEDLRALAGELRERGISLVVDLVCNHTAREHTWARRAAAGEAPYTDYYLMYADRREPDAWEQTLPEVFPDFAPGSFTWVPECERWVWTTFNGYQWDLNYANPDVLVEMVEVLCFLANLGVEVVRLDAVAFLWKRLGTSSQNQPEVHLLLQLFRALTRVVAPATLLLAEAIVAPEDLVPYLGRGEGTGKECELAYHNVLMVGLWSGLAEGSAVLVTQTLRSMPAIPPTAAWLTYVRLHDDIGWAISDEVAAAVGGNGHDHRSFLSDFYSGDFPESFARGEVFQANPATGDRRISGSLASLAGLEDALESGDVLALDLAIGRILLLHHVVLVFGGIPLLYMGDEIGLLNDRSYLDDPALAGDNRWLHRPRMDWTAAERRTDPTAVAGRIFGELARLTRLRAATPELHAQQATEAVWTGNDQVLGVLRQGPRGRLLVLANLSPRPQWVQVESPLTGGTDLVTQEPTGRVVRLAAYQVRWLRP